MWRDRRARLAEECEPSQTIWSFEHCSSLEYLLTRPQEPPLECCSITGTVFQIRRFLVAHVKSAIVIGGGIAGPAAALALRKAGIEAIVYEAYPSTAEGMGGMLMVAPNAQRIGCHRS